YAPAAINCHTARSDGPSAPCYRRDMKLRVLLPALLAVACGGAKPDATLPVSPATPVQPAADATITPAASQTAASPAKKVRTVEGITEYRLDNGLTVLLFPDPTQSTLTVNITYLVGSRHEGYGETGMAHLLEHML